RSLTGGIVSPDDVSLSGGAATFRSAERGNGKTVTGTGFSLTGTEAGNYQLASTTLTTSANITPKTLTGHFLADDKVYDGNTSASITSGSRSLTGGIVSPDDVSLSGGAATF